MAAPPTKETLFQVLSKYAGRIASTSDPLVHQKAGKQLQADLRRWNEGEKGKGGS